MNLQSAFCHALDLGWNVRKRGLNSDSDRSYCKKSKQQKEQLLVGRNIAGPLSGISKLHG